MPRAWISNLDIVANEPSPAPFTLCFRDLAELHGRRSDGAVSGEASGLGVVVASDPTTTFGVFTKARTQRSGALLSERSCLDSCLGHVTP